MISRRPLVGFMLSAPLMFRLGRKPRRPVGTSLTTSTTRVTSTSLTTSR